MPAGDFHADRRDRLRAPTRFEPLDRVNGGLVAWPSGKRLVCVRRLLPPVPRATVSARTKLAELSARTAGRLPYFGSAAFRTVYGDVARQLWRDFTRDEAAQAAAGADAEPAMRLTHHGFVVDGPRFDRDGSIVYADGTRTSSRRSIGLRRDGASRPLATRYGGSQVGVSDDALYFDQLEVRQSVALSGDVYRLDRRMGTVKRLTHGARLTEVDAVG